MREMTDSHECDFPDTCQVCVPRLKPPVDTIDYSFAAKYWTECQTCDGAIYPGQTAVRMKPSGKIVCDVCSGSAEVLRFL